MALAIKCGPPLLARCLAVRARRRRTPSDIEMATPPTAADNNGGLDDNDNEREGEATAPKRPPLPSHVVSSSSSSSSPIDPNIDEDFHRDGDWPAGEPDGQSGHDAVRLAGLHDGGSDGDENEDDAGLVPPGTE